MTYSKNIKNIFDDADRYVSAIPNNPVPRNEAAFIQTCLEILHGFSTGLVLLSETANRGNCFLHEMIEEVDNDIKHAETFLLNERNDDFFITLIRQIFTIRSKYARLAKFHEYFCSLERMLISKNITD